MAWRSKCGGACGVTAEAQASCAELEIEALTTGYGKTEILRSVSLTVERGQCVGLIGPNGHGKTTLLRTAGGLHRPWSGTVRLRGEDITGWSAGRLVQRGLVHVPQGDLLFGDLTVEEHLIIPLRRQRRRARMTRIEVLYEVFPRLEERRSQYARSLSGGEKRMLAIARSLLLGAHTLLIDEPSLGLSPLMVDNVYRQIRELSASGITILIVEENPARLRGLASDVYLLDLGAIAAHLPTEALLEDSSLLTTYLGATFETAETA